MTGVLLVTAVWLVVASSPQVVIEFEVVAGSHVVDGVELDGTELDGTELDGAVFPDSSVDVERWAGEVTTVDGATLETVDDDSVDRAVDDGAVDGGAVDDGVVEVELDVAADDATVEEDAGDGTADDFTFVPERPAAGFRPAAGSAFDRSVDLEVSVDFDRLAGGLNGDLAAAAFGAAAVRDRSAPVGRFSALGFG